MGAVLIPQSSGAPVSSTGAPGEQTCATSTCHDDGTPNTGKGQPSLTIIGTDDNLYEAGKTYRIHITMQHPVFTKRFGFQLVALDANNKNAGTLTVADEDAERTQIISNPIALTDRRYMTYTYPGTAANAEGKGSWVLNWTAPSNSSGPITFYGATVAANNDDSDKGDEVYTFVSTLSPRQVVSTVEHDDTPIIQLYPNPTHDELHLQLPETWAGSTGRILNMAGQEVRSFVLPSGNTQHLDIHQLSRGAYTIQLASTTGAHYCASFIKE